MGIVEIVGMMATVATAAWAIAEKINTMHKELDDRLDGVVARQIEIENTVHRNCQKVSDMEVSNRAWFAKIHKDIYQCTIPPQN